MWRCGRRGRRLREGCGRSAVHLSWVLGLGVLQLLEGELGSVGTCVSSPHRSLTCLLGRDRETRKALGWLGGFG